MFNASYNEYLRTIENYLESLLLGEETICKSMKYSLVGGGKRIRPVLALASAAAVGGNYQVIVPAAAALELIHTYSLIHDDLPAMDNDDYRRGKLSNHKVFGDGIAILSGDGLLTLAFELLAQPLDRSVKGQLRVIKEVAEAIGWQGMVGGQAADLEGEGKELTLSELQAIHQGKTGALLTVSARLGAILAGGAEEQIEALTDYAKALGLAFQIKDDILDIEGDSETLGKPVGSDEKHHKATYPSLLGMTKSKALLSEQIAIAQKALIPLGEKAFFLSELASYIGDRKH